MLYNDLCGTDDILLASKAVGFDKLVTVTYTRRGERTALANNIDHIIKSPPLMSRDAPVM